MKMSSMKDFCDMSTKSNPQSSKMLVFALLNRYLASKQKVL